MNFALSENRISSYNALCQIIPVILIIPSILTILCSENVVFSNKTRIWRLCEIIKPAGLIWGNAVCEKRQCGDSRGQKVRKKWKLIYRQPLFLTFLGANILVSAFTITVIAIDRWISVTNTNPSESLTYNRVFFVIGSMWTMAFACKYLLLFKTYDFNFFFHIMKYVFLEFRWIPPI